MPAGSLGKLVQLGYGMTAPRGIAANLLGTSIVTTSAATAADAAVNLKCGHLLGANPPQCFGLARMDVPLAPDRIGFVAATKVLEQQRAGGKLPQLQKPRHQKQTQPTK